MEETSVPKNLQAIGYEAGNDVLREIVMDAGGFEGVFRELREDWDTAYDKYEMLLVTSTTPEQREANKEANAKGDRTIQETVMSLAAENGIPSKDAPAFFLAAIVTRRAGLMEE